MQRAVHEPGRASRIAEPAAEPRNAERRAVLCRDEGEVIMPLTDAKARTLKPADRLYAISDGEGLETTAGPRRGTVVGPLQTFASVLERLGDDL